MKCCHSMSLFLFVLLGAVASGCVPSRSLTHRQPFETKSLDACLTIVVDMSGSFYESWEERAYPLFLELMDRFFVEGTGADSRIVICQLSAAADVVLFEGSPDDLRATFTSPETLDAFLRERSDPSGSPVYEATERAIGYVTSMPRVSEETRLLTVILSDMAHYNPADANDVEAGTKMFAALQRYGAMGGGLALYCVAESEAPRWGQILTAAGFQPGLYVVESELVANPQLPQFD